MHKKILLFSILLLFILQTSAANINVVLISPSPKKNSFWSQVTKITQASANDLNVNLTIYNNISNRVLLDELFNDIKLSTKKPDYIIFMPFGGRLEHTFSLLEEAKIPFVTIERTYERELHFQQIGKPLEKFNYLIGEIFFNNFKASELLTKSLYKVASDMNKTSQHSLTAFGLSGDFHSGTKKRERGLLQVAKQKSIKVKQLVYTNWQQDTAREKLLKLINRHGKADIIWCASDINSVGALEAIKQLNLKPNKDVFIGGFDWTTSALKLIKENQLTASVGGHIFEGARALIKIFDYHHGIDNFNRNPEYQGYLLEVIDVDNIKNYERLTQENEWKNVDFSLFSSAKQKEAITFNTENILSSIHKH